MTAVLHLYHDTTFDLVREEDLGEQRSLGVRTVASAASGAEERRHKVAFDSPGGFTKVELSPDFDGSPRALANLVDALTDRHSDKITAVSGTDSALVTRMAALLDANVVEHDPDYTVGEQA